MLARVLGGGSLRPSMSMALVESESESLSTLIVEAIADYANADPLALDVPLYEVIETDALDAMFRCGADSGLEVSFRYQGIPVSVTHSAVHVDGTVYPRGGE